MSADVAGEETLEGIGAALHGTIEFDNMAFDSITAFRTHDYFSVTDTDRTPVAWSTDGDPEDQEQFSQEFRLTSTKGDRLDWIAGLYFFSQHTDNTSFVELESDLLAWVGLPSGAPLHAEARGIVETDSYAVFGQGIYRFNDNLDLTVGPAGKPRQEVGILQSDGREFPRSYRAAWSVWFRCSWIRRTGLSRLAMSPCRIAGMTM